jgi:RimJ/RimL family protein N-acetyltransferase
MLTEQIGVDRWLIYDEPRLLDWCARQIPGLSADAWHREGARGIGVGTSNDIIAVMVAHGYEPAYRSVQISMAATRPTWARRSTIQRLLNYPFRTLKVDRVTTLIASSNHRALKFNEGLGFVREGLLKNGCGDDDRVVLGLYRGEAIHRGWIA